MSSPAMKVAEYLQLMGHGHIAGSGKWSISVSREALEPADVIVVQDTGGPTHDTDDLDDLPTIQVRVRSLDFQEGWDKQENIMNSLIFPTPIDLNGEVRLGCKLVSGILDVGRDNADRHILVANYQLERKQ